MPLEAPVFVVPGNHDKRQSFREAFAHVVPFRPGPRLDYEAHHGGLRILALDTLVEGEVAGRLTPEQLDWLAGKLAAPDGKLTLLLMHHPAFRSGIPSLDRMALIEGSERLGEIVALYRGPLRIHAGHIHRPFHTIWNGVFCAVGGSPAFQHELNLDPSALEPGAIAEPYAYFLHQVESPVSVRVHTRYVTL
jgi:3',5'-cyclic AMP phosphodiesterase CpdA